MLEDVRARLPRFIAHDGGGVLERLEVFSLMKMELLEAMVSNSIWRWLLRLKSGQYYVAAMASQSIVGHVGG